MAFNLDSSKYRDCSKSAAPTQSHIACIKGLYSWIIKYSDGKADKELVQRWINIESNRGMVALLHPNAKVFGEARTFFCDGREARRPLGCEGLQVNAMELGVITDLTIWRLAESP